MEANPKIEDALAVDLLKMGRSIHFAGEPGLSWYELLALVRGQWPEMHVSRERVAGVGLLDPATRALVLVADATREASWRLQAGRDTPPPDSSQSLIFPELAAREEAKTGAAPARRFRPTTQAELQAVRDRIAALQATAVPS